MKIKAEYRRSREGAHPAYSVRCLAAGLLALCFLVSLPVQARGRRSSKPAKPKIDPWYPVKTEDSAMFAKLDSLVVPRLEMDAVDLGGAFKFLRKSSKELDPDGRGVNFIISSEVVKKRFSINLSNIPILDAVRYICILTNVECVLQRGVVIIKPRPKKKPADSGPAE